MKRTLMVWSVTVFLIFGLSSCQVSDAPAVESAGYQQQQDVYIVFHGWYFSHATSFLPQSLISDLLFELQEGTHDSITDVTGAEIDHYYIWLCLEDLCIPVDPFSYNY